MEGERRKRKLEEEEEEEENEEQKMEKFFALIKSTKDLLSSKEKTDKKDEEKKEKGIWNPTFQLEDFIGCGGELGKNNVFGTNHAAGPSEKEKEVMIIEKDISQVATTAAAAAPAEENEEKGKASYPLDLNLSL